MKYRETPEEYGCAAELIAALEVCSGSGDSGGAVLVPRTVKGFKALFPVA